MPTARRTQKNLRLSDEQVDAIEQLRRRGDRVVPRERYLRALVDRHITGVFDDDAFDAWTYVQYAENGEQHDRFRALIETVDAHRGERSRLQFVQEIVGGLGRSGSVLAELCDAVIVTDANLIVTVWNRGAERLFQWSADEALGRNVRDVVPSAFSPQESNEHIAAMRECEGGYRLAGTWYAKDGTAVRAEAVFQPIASGLVGVFREIGNSQT